jgi:hypothetical protein
MEINFELSPKRDQFTMLSNASALSFLAGMGGSSSERPL